MRSSLYCILSQSRNLRSMVPRPRRPPPLPPPGSVAGPSKVPIKSNTLADYVNANSTLQRLVDLGVDLKAVESKGNAADFFIKLDHERDVVPRLQFLMDTVGLPILSLGAWVTKNPWLFKQSLDDLQVRLNYLVSKKFSRYQIASIVSVSPYWLNMPVKVIDQRLGFLQKEFDLKGDEIRQVAATAPELLIQGTGKIKELRFCFLEELGFSAGEIRHIFLKDPQLWTMDRELIRTNFTYLQFTIGLSHRRIALEPQTMRAEPSLLRLRHEFLVKRGRDQYDPEKPLFVPVSDLLLPDDADFAVHIAKSSEEEYDQHLMGD